MNKACINCGTMFDARGKACFCSDKCRIEMAQKRGRAIYIKKQRKTPPIDAELKEYYAYIRENGYISYGKYKERQFIKK